MQTTASTPTTELFIGLLPLTEIGFHNELNRLRGGAAPAIDMDLAGGGYRGRLECPKRRSSVQEAFGQIFRAGDDEPIAYCEFHLMEVRTASSDQRVFNRLYDEVSGDVAVTMLELFECELFAASQALGLMSIVYGLQFRPSADLTAEMQAQAFKAFMDGLHAHLNVGFHLVLVHGSGEAEKLLHGIGCMAVDEDHVGYTSLDAAALDKLGAMGDILLAAGFGSATADAV